MKGQQEDLMNREEEQPEQKVASNPRFAPFVPVPRLVVERLAKMRPGALALYVILLSHRNYRTGCCNPSLNLLARQMEVSHDTVQRSLAVLEAEGLVTRVCEAGRFNLYEFPHLTTRMDASGSDRTTRMRAAQPHATVRSEHTQPCGRNKEEQEVFNKTLEQEVEVPAPEPPQPKHRLQTFQKPTLNEVAEYCSRRGNAVDPEQFLAFYESNGWMVGRHRMRNWRAAIITWECRDKNGNQSESKQNRVLANLAKAKAVYHA